jgi:hypothetical protein
LLRSGGYSTELQKWYDRLTPLVQRARERLKTIEPSRLAQRSGCTLGPDGTYTLEFFWQDYAIRPPHFSVMRADTGQETTSFIQALLLTYLDNADGTPPSGRWIAYRELPNGMFYANAFRGYAENQLVHDLDTEGGLDAFRRAAAQLEGRAIDIGDAGYAFQVLPHIHLAAAYWDGDEDFGAQASILFEDSAIHYMSTDGLAVLGSHLANAIVRAAQEAGIRQSPPSK